MRGNDVLQASPDIMVTDSLTGNIMVKMLSSFTTGGSLKLQDLDMDLESEKDMNSLL